jgi:V8-like Glu-specific endopeptidase
MFNKKGICAGLLSLLAGPALAWDVPPPGSWFPVGQFGSPPVKGGVHEKVQGAPDFIRVATLDAADPDLQLSRKIGFLVFETVENGRKVEGMCSGSLIGPDLFLTNHHCISNDAGGINDPSRYIVDMEYLREGVDPQAASLSKITQFVAWDESLDFALLRLSKPLGKSYGWITIETDEDAIARNRDVKIIQHPAGRPKEIVRDHTAVVDSNGVFLHYLADTEGGSSGSPVFARTGDHLIALHHVGTANYNEGVKMTAILPHIRAYLPITGGAPAVPVPTRATPAPAAPQPGPAAAPAPKQPAAPKPAQGGWTPVTGD